MSTETKREVKLPNGDTVFLRRPGMLDHEDAEWEYARIFNKAIKNGIVPREVMREQLREQGIWTEDDDAKTEQYDEDIAYAMADLQRIAEDGEEEAFEAAKKRVTELRAEYMAHTNRLGTFLNNCAEEKASEARMFYLTYACTEREDGKPYWKSYNEFKSYKDPACVNTAFVNFMLFMHNVSSNIVSSLPENNVALKTKDMAAELDKADKK